MMGAVADDGGSARVAWVQRWQRSLPGHSWRRADDLNLATHALALAAQQVLCTAPLLVAASAVLRRVDQQGPGVLLPRYLGLTGKAAADVSSLFSGASSSVSVSELAAGVGLSFVFGMGAGATVQRSFETVWAQPPLGRRSIGRHALWLAGLLAYVFIVLGVGRGAHRIHGHTNVRLVARVVVQLVASFLFFWWSQHMLLGGRISWRRLRAGAASIAVATATLVALSGFVLPGQITDEVRDYGLVGAAFVLSVWLVTLSGLVIGGALVGAVLDERRNPIAA